MSTQTIDSADLNSAPTRRPGESPRQQSVCIEIPISVHGSRSASGSLNNSQAAKPFLEETRTMIVFPQGAVLRLTEPVSEGQILILKNVRVKQEVACRVVSSKTNASAKGYVEVEFFQPAPGFWGITFPAATPSAGKVEPAQSVPAPKQPRIEPSAVKPAFFQPPVAPKPAPPVAPVISKPAAAPVAPAAVISEPPVAASVPEPASVSSTPVSAPPPTPVAPARVAPGLTPDSTQELNRAIAAAWASPIEPAKPIKKVEPVQEAKPAKEAVVAPSAPSPSISDSFPLAGSKSLNPTKPKSMPVTASRETVSSPEPLATADSIGYPAPQVPANAPAISSVKLNRKSASSSSIETRKVELTSSQIASETVVGKPMFSGGAEASAKQQPSSGRTWMIAVAAVVLLGAGGGTYWWKTNHKLDATKSDTVSAAAPANTTSAVPVASASAQPGIAPAGTNSQPATNPTSSPNSSANQKSGSVPAGAASNSVAAKPDKNSPTVTSRRPNVLQADKIAAPVSHSTGSSIAATPAPDVISKTASVPTGSLSSILPGMGQPSSVPAPPAPSRPSGPPPSASVLQQPKLLQSTSPIYPKIAATRGDWGDVVIDALVAENGRVADTKVISGPDTLRQSALQVVRTQTYQPAKLNGKPVSMHVTVKVPFPKPR